MANVVRFALDTARNIEISGVGWFREGVLDVDANNLMLVARARFLVQPYRAVEIGIVDEFTPRPTLPAIPMPAAPDPYPQYLLPEELDGLYLSRPALQTEDFDLGGRWDFSGATVLGIEAGPVGETATPLGAVNVLDHGAVGDGTADDTAAILAAFTAAPNNGAVLFPAGYTFRISGVSLPAKAVTALAYGATLETTTAGTFAVTQTTRNRVTWMGGRVTGIGSGFRLALTASEVQSYDFAFSGVSFDLPATQTAMYLSGGREGTITNCWFDNCTAIRLFETVNTHITGCQFRNCTKGVWGDGTTGSANNAGVMLNNVTMLGCGYGVHVVGHDWTSIINSMIDYCDRPVVLVNQDIAVISGSYFSNREFSGQVVPTLQFITDSGQGGESTKHIKVTDCSVINNVGALPDQSVGISFTGGSEWTMLANNTIHFWRKYGIQISGVNTYVKVLGNDVVSPAPQSGAAGLYGSNGNDSTWIVKDNFFSSAMANVVSPAVDGTGGGSVTASEITDSTTVGREVLTAADQAAARTAIGAGTSSVTQSSVDAKAARTFTKRTVSANYTLVAGDATDIVLHSTAAAAITITLPQDSAVTIAQEIAIPWRAYGAGQITFAAGTGATIISRGSVFKSAGQYAEGLVTKLAANTWLVTGDLTA